MCPEMPQILAQSWQSSFADHEAAPSQIVEEDGSPTWVTRGSNFVVAITRASAGLRLQAHRVPDEHMVLLPDCGATLRAGLSPAREATGYHLAIMPPGDSEIVTAAGGLVVRCFSHRYQPMLARASNAADFKPARGDVAPLQDWPAPVAGFSLRLYDLNEALTAGDKNRCYRSSNMMINILRERLTPRSLHELTPHAHDDFEQGSIALGGRFVHHLRTPWGKDATLWQPDSALEVGSPSVAVIAPKIVHTTRNIGPASALLADLFCPPREDFSRRPGMVRNADDYPPPAWLGGQAEEPRAPRSDTLARP